VLRRLLPCGACVFRCALHDDHNYTRATRDPDILNFARTSRGSGIPAQLASSSGCARATDNASTLAVAIGEGRTVTPLVNPHLMTTQTKQGFLLPTDKLTMSTTSSSPLSPVPTFVRAALADPS
jgi:hypothetical protein